MAEIHVEKKKPVWPWIILVLVILAILYFLFFADGQNNDDLDDMDTTEQVEDTTVWENETNDTADWDTNNNMNDTLGYAAGGVSGYVAHIGDESRMGVDHEYTNNALLQLISAVEGKARELNIEIESEMQQIRQDAQNLTQNPQARDHAGNIKNAGSGITNVLENIQQERFPELSQDVEQLRSSVEDIDPSVETLEQKDRINSFFHEAADVLQKMN